MDGIDWTKNNRLASHCAEEDLFYSSHCAKSQFPVGHRAGFKKKFPSIGGNNKWSGS